MKHILGGKAACFRCNHRRYRFLMAGKQVRCLCCPAAVRGARPKQELGKIDCADSASWTHRSFFNRSVATGKPGRPGPRGEPSQKIRHGGCVLLAKDEGDGCNIRAFLRDGWSRSIPQGNGRNFLRHHQNVWVKLWAMPPDIPTAVEHQYLNIEA